MNRERNGISPLEDIIAQSVAAAMNRTVAPPMRQFLRLALVGLLTLAGAIFLLVAAYLALANVMQAYWAAAIVGGGAIAAAGLPLVAGHIGKSMRSSGRRASHREADGISPALEAVAREIKASPKEAAAIALAAGVLTGSSAEFRQSLQRMFDE